MPLRLYNTLTRPGKPDLFVPIDRANVRLYACGPTVYDHLHIGNGRMLIVFDVLFRLLRHIYGPDCVTYVRNITDIDDKINARAAERGVDIRVLTDEMTKDFHEDAKALGCLAPTVEPRATEHIAEMIALIEKLIAKGHAYVAEGHVLFDVPSMPAYGHLSKRSLNDMIAGARVEVAPYKRGPMDFVLWKPSSPNEPGWESPWGRGRPGWHIECSAMSWKHLGEVFDIHGGGIDLLFPHHENEMAQSCSAFGHDLMANVWMHNGHLQVEGEKMSKSFGNFVTIRELLTTDKFGGRSWPGEVLRLAILKTHYRQPIDFTVKALEEAERTCAEWFVATSHIDSDAEVPEAVLQRLLDDLNTSAALAAMRETPAAPASMRELDVGQRAENVEARSQLKASLELLGIRLQREHFERRLLELRAPDNPPFRIPAPSSETILGAWVPPSPQPEVARNLNPALLAVPTLNSEDQLLGMDELIAYQVQSAAEWRRHKAEEFPEDPRNVEAANLLERLYQEFISLEGSALHRRAARLVRIDEALFYFVEIASVLTRAVGFTWFPRNAEEFLTRFIEDIESHLETIKRIETEYLQESGLNKSELDALILARNAARSAKDFVESDRIRDELAREGIVLKDNKNGTTTWEPKR
jgi:cysteinyl-tRNA synthetase